MRVKQSFWFADYDEAQEAKALLEKQDQIDSMWDDHNEVETK